MLAKIFDRPMEFHSDYPEEVWSYLNSVPPGETGTETRRARLPSKEEDMTFSKLVVGSVLVQLLLWGQFGLAANVGRFEYRVLATKKTSNMQKELNEAGTEGFRFEAVMGGETSWGGSEAVVVISRERAAEKKPSFEYKLLATNKTSTMQKEMQQVS